MKISFWEFEKPFILQEIESYIQGCNEEEREEYNKELNEVKHDFLKLTESGVFHDAIGQVIKTCAIGAEEELFVEVETEY
jgi:hypothetical protein